MITRRLKPLRFGLWAEFSWVARCSEVDDQNIQKIIDYLLFLQKKSLKAENHLNWNFDDFKKKF